MIICAQCQTENERGSSFCSECASPLPSDSSEDISNRATRYFASDFQEGPAAQELKPGTLFAGRYTIEEKIAEGGMGTVYRAVETLAGQERQIALKLIRADLAIDRKSMDKLIAEGAMTQNIRHRNIVAVHNVGEADGQPFVAMEYVAGVPLREWLRRQVNERRDVEVGVAAAIVQALLDGLEAAHELGIVHRDLKPENIVLTAEPTAGSAPLKILDFGIARAPGAPEGGTNFEIGTPRYMAPEQVTNPQGAKATADLYSLSLIFYELLMEVLPQGHWQPPSGGRGDVPVGIDRLIESGLSNRPGARPQSAAEYRERLDEAFRDEGVDDVQWPEADTEPELFGIARKKALAGLGVFGVVVLAVMSMSSGGDDATVNQTQQAVVQTANVAGNIVPTVPDAAVAIEQPGQDVSPATLPSSNTPIPDESSAKSSPALEGNNSSEKSNIGIVDFGVAPRIGPDRLPEGASNSFNAEGCGFGNRSSIEKLYFFVKYKNATPGKTQFRGIAEPIGENINSLGLSCSNKFDMDEIDNNSGIYWCQLSPTLGEGRWRIELHVNGKFVKSKGFQIYSGCSKPN